MSVRVHFLYINITVLVKKNFDIDSKYCNVMHSLWAKHNFANTRKLYQLGVRKPNTVRRRLEFGM